MKKIFLTIIFIVTINFNASSSNPILDELKKIEYNYLDYALEKIAEDIKSTINYNEKTPELDIYGLEAFGLKYLGFEYDDDVIVLYITLSQRSKPDTEWHKTTYEEYKLKVRDYMARRIFRYFGAWGKIGPGTAISRFLEHIISRNEINFNNKSIPYSKILSENNKFLFMPDEWEEYLKTKKQVPTFSEEEKKQIEKKLFSSIYLGLNIAFQKSPTSNFNPILKNEKWERCYSKYRLDATFKKNKTGNEMPIPIRSKCFQGKYR